MPPLATILTGARVRTLARDFAGVGKLLWSFDVC
jgi:hypothetical protein